MKIFLRGPSNRRNAAFLAASEGPTPCLVPISRLRSSSACTALCPRATLRTALASRRCHRDRRLTAAPGDLRALPRAGAGIVLSLFAVEELSHREIADILGIPEGTVWSRLAAARRELSKALEGERGHQNGKP